MNTIYLRILQLDSLTHILTAYERAMAHKKSKNYPVFEEDTKNIKILINIVNEYCWNAPEIKYTESRELKFLDEEFDKWLPLEKYEHAILEHVKLIFNPNINNK